MTGGQLPRNFTFWTCHGDGSAQKAAGTSGEKMTKV